MITIIPLHQNLILNIHITNQDYHKFNASTVSELFDLPYTGRIRGSPKSIADKSNSSLYFNQSLTYKTNTQTAYKFCSTVKNFVFSSFAVYCRQIITIKKSNFAETAHRMSTEIPSVVYLLLIIDKITCISTLKFFCSMWKEVWPTESEDVSLKTETGSSPSGTITTAVY